MSKQYYTVLTTYGSQQFAAAMANNRPLNITHFAVGDGNGRAIQPDSSRTALVRQVHKAAVSSISVDPRNNKQIIFELTLAETVGGFWVREMGLFDSQNRLIAHANCPDSYKPLLADGSGKIQILRMILLVSSSNAVSLTVDNRVIWATRNQLTPKKITATSTNQVTDDGHTHEIDLASLTTKGLVQLTNDTGLDSESLALTAKGAKALAQLIAAAQQLAAGKWTAVDATTDRKGIVQLNSAINSTSTTQAATPKAVKEAYDKAQKAESKIDSLKIGSRNLLLESDTPYLGNNYSLTYHLAEAPEVGEPVVITLWGEIGAQRTSIDVYNTQGRSGITSLTKIREGVYQGKGVWRKPMNGTSELTPNDTHLAFFFSPNTATDDNRVERVQLERGNMGTDWCPNERDSRMRLIRVSAGSVSTNINANLREDWFRELRIPQISGNGYYARSFYGKAGHRKYTNFPLDTTAHFTAEVFHQQGFSFIRLTYPSLGRSFESAVNFNSETLSTNWREILFTQPLSTMFANHINKPLAIGKNEWSRVMFPVKNAANEYFQLEFNPNAQMSDPESIRFNVIFRQQTDITSTIKHLSFPEWGTKNEVVAYRSWVVEQGNTNFVRKNGDTMTGELHSQHFGYGNYLDQYWTGAPFVVEAMDDRTKDTFHPFLKGKMRSHNNHGSAFSFGYTSHQGQGDGFGYGAIVWTGDNARYNGVDSPHQMKYWKFEPSGNFVAATGDVFSDSGRSINTSVARLGSNDIQLRWTGANLNLKVDATELGSIALHRDFIGNLSETGWTRLPNGLILQWGRNVSREVFFPIAFPNACFSVTFSVNNNSALTMNNPMIIGLPSREKFDWYVWGTAQAVHWFAIGR